MHLRLLAFFTLINSTVMLSQTSRKLSASRDVTEDCKGCLECSGDNGCLKCPEKLFLFIRREGMRQQGSCLHACPAGHFGLRGQDVNRCIKCKTPNCERCFSKDFCMKCKVGFLLFKGKCLSDCPEGTVPHLTDCVEGCELGFWGEWSPCSHNERSCGQRWGSQSRDRELSRRGPDEATACPPQSETRRCRLKKRCPGEKRKNEKKNGRKKGRKQRKPQVTATVTAQASATVTKRAGAVVTEPPGGT
nr:PREDICTED: R-spondin-4 isoform X2 [Lepisosteus oculatus]